MKKTLILSILTSLLLSNSLSSAASTENYEQYQAAKRQEEQQQKQIKAPSVTLQEDKQAEDAEKIIMLPKEPNRFRIKEFVIDSGKCKKFNWLVEKLEPYQGRRVGAAGVDMLVKLLSEELMTKGYITTRIVVPEQELKQAYYVFSCCRVSWRIFVLQMSVSMGRGAQLFRYAREMFLTFMILSRVWSK